MIDKIVVAIFVINGLINLYIINHVSKSYWNETGNKLSEQMFFRAYIYVVPFFITRQILKEIIEKHEQTNRNTKIHGTKKKSK
jgi:hypothetical protein